VANRGVKRQEDNGQRQEAKKNICVNNIMSAFRTSNVSRVPPSNPFDEIDAYINQLPPTIPKLDTISIFKPSKGLPSGAYGKAYANETHVMKMIDLEHQIKITRHNSYPELIEKITRSIQSEIVHYYAISEICPNVCKLIGYAYDSAKHKLYIYMENCGTDLFEMYASIPSPETTRKYIGQLVNAIDCLHKNGYVHRDLKTENITVSREGIVQLIDFGMARNADDVAYPLGTLGYMSPENMRPGVLTFDMLKASDIWSLGVTFMFMLLPHALTSKLGPELTNEIIDKLFVNDETNGPLTFVQRINQLFTIEDGHFIMNTCSDEIKKIFGPSITMDSFFRNDWIERATIEELKIAFYNTMAENTMMPLPPPTSTKKPKTKSDGGKSRRKRRGSKPAKNHGAYKKTRSSRK